MLIPRQKLLAVKALLDDVGDMPDTPTSPSNQSVVDNPWQGMFEDDV